MTTSVRASGRPLGAALRLVAVLRDLVVSAVRDFVVASVQDGRLRTKGLPAGVRVAVMAAVALAVALFVSIVGADAWRSLDPAPLSGTTQVLRGTVIPGPLLPVTFALLAFAVALCVSGALRASPWVATAVVAVYAVVGSFMYGLAPGGGLGHTLTGWAVVGLVAFAVVVRRLPPHPTVELLVTLVLVGATFSGVHQSLAAIDGASGTGFLRDQTTLLLSDVLFLSTPLVVVAALAVVDFGVTAARWGLRFVDVRLGQRSVLLAVALLGAWRARDLVTELLGNVGEHGWGEELRGLTGSAALAGALAGMALAFRRVTRRGLAHEDPQETVVASARIALPLTVWLVLVSVLNAVAYLLIQGVVPVLSPTQVAPVQERLADVISVLGDFGISAWWDLIRGLGAGGAAWALARRGRLPAAAFLGGVALVLLHSALTAPGRVLVEWTWTLRGVDLIAVGSLVALLVRWALARRLTERRAEWALYLLLLTGLLREGDFVSDPFAPFLAFAGGAFVLFGLVWGLATGLAWANEGSPALPRVSRAQLLLGYQLLSIAILHWYLVTHDLESLEILTEIHPGTGTSLLGQPLLLVVILTALVSGIGDVAIRTADEDEEPPAET